MNTLPQAAAQRGAGAMPACEIAVEWLEAGAVPSTAVAGISHFTGAGGVGEVHITLALESECHRPTEALERAWLAMLESAGLTPASTVMRRVFCSDAVNQAAQLRAFAEAHPGAFSIIGQTPMAGGKFALWSQHILDPAGPPDGSGGGARFSLDRGPLRHCWLSGHGDTRGGDARSQADAILDSHNQWLAENGMTLRDDCVRTWWFVRDIDANYPSLVDARREVFRRHGLTEKTHYIASTGIAGTHPAAAALMSLDSYAIRGLVPGQVEHLCAPDHLSPTHLYGVTFERATAVSYADRRHVLLSGTASIDADGRIVHPGDVLRQLDRTLENIAALLAAANASPGDLAMILVYLRDPADAPAVARVLQNRLGGLPTLLLQAPVCRPGWLIEIEGVAIVSDDRPDFPGF